MMFITLILSLAYCNPALADWGPWIRGIIMAPPTPATSTVHYPLKFVTVTADKPDNAYGAMKPGQTIAINNKKIIDVQLGIKDINLGTQCSLFLNLPGKSEGTTQWAIDHLQRWILVKPGYFHSKGMKAQIFGSTTYNNRPERFGRLYDFTPQPGQSIKIAEIVCPDVGQTVQFEIAANSPHSAVYWKQGVTGHYPIGLAMYQHH